MRSFDDCVSICLLTIVFLSGCLDPISLIFNLFVVSITLLSAHERFEYLITGRDDNCSQQASRYAIVLERSERLIEQQCIDHGLVDDLGAHQCIDGPTRSVAEGKRPKHVA